jgi:outer membrane protein assembly factor BamB
VRSASGSNVSCGARAVVVLVAVLVALPLSLPAQLSVAAADAASGPSVWLTYHRDQLSDGLSPASGTLLPLRLRWSSPILDGQLYGEPLIDDGLVFVATESDTVYAFSASTGHLAWFRHLAQPVPSKNVECGDIAPTVGITGTPVIDPSRDELFLVADEWVDNARIQHHLVGLDAATGRIRLDEDVDPVHSNSAAQLQRTGMALDDDKVVFGFGSNAGDCNTKPYHGYIVAAPVGGGRVDTLEISTGPGALYGSVWMGGASPVVDARGNIWIATGNGWAMTPAQPYDRSDSVLELSPSLKVEQYFAPATWEQDNAADADLGSTAPALVRSFVFIVGKSRTAYLLDRGDLGGIGGNVASLAVCGPGTGTSYSESPFGGDAVKGSTVYVPCRNGVSAIAVHGGPTPSMTLQWTVPTGASGPPIIAGGLLWTISQTGVLYGVNLTDGESEVSEQIGGISNHFPTPAVAGGRLFVPVSQRLLVFGRG